MRIESHFVRMAVGAAMLGLQPVVFLVGGLYAGLIFSAMVGTLKYSASG